MVALPQDGPGRLAIAPRYLRVAALLCARLPLDRVDWALTGSLSHRLQGADIPVHDVDVQADEDDVAQVAAFLAEFICEPPRVWESDLLLSRYAAFRMAGVRVEVMGGMRKRATPAQPWGPPVRPASHRLIVERDGLAVPVLSLAHDAQAYEAIGRHDRAALLRGIIARAG